MPARELIFLRPASKIATTIDRSQCPSSATWSPWESEPSSARPRRHSTKPPQRERQAEPEPWRARTERSRGVRAWPAAAQAAPVRAAKAAEELARPAAAGKLDSLTTVTRGRQGSSRSR